MQIYIDFSNPVDTVDFVDRFITTFKDQTQKVPPELLVRVFHNLCDGVLIEVPQKNLAHVRSSIEVLNESYADKGVQLRQDTYHAFLQHLKCAPARVLVPLFKGDHYTPHGVYERAINEALFPYELACWYESDEEVQRVTGHHIDLDQDVQFSNEDSKSEDEKFEDFSPIHQNSSVVDSFNSYDNLSISLPPSPSSPSYYPQFTPTLERQNAQFFDYE